MKEKGFPPYSLGSYKMPHISLYMLLQDANHKPKSNGWYNLNLNGWTGWRVRLVVILHWLCSCCFMIGSFESGQCGDWLLIGCCKAPLNFPIYQTRYMVNTQLLASLFQPVFGASSLLLSSSLKSLFCLLLLRADLCPIFAPTSNVLY